MEDFKKYFPETDFQSLKINVTVQFVNKYSTSCSVESFLSIYLVVLIFFFLLRNFIPFFIFASLFDSTVSIEYLNKSIFIIP